MEELENRKWKSLRTVFQNSLKERNNFKPEDETWKRARTGNCSGPTEGNLLRTQGPDGRARTGNCTGPTDGKLLFWHQHRCGSLLDWINALCGGPPLISKWFLSKIRRMTRERQAIWKQNVTLTPLPQDKRLSYFDRFKNSLWSDFNQKLLKIRTSTVSFFYSWGKKTHEKKHTWETTQYVSLSAKLEPGFRWRPYRNKRHLFSLLTTSKKPIIWDWTRTSADGIRRCKHVKIDFGAAILMRSQTL